MHATLISQRPSLVNTLLPQRIPAFVIWAKVICMCEPEYLRTPLHRIYRGVGGSGGMRLTLLSTCVIALSLRTCWAWSQSASGETT